MSMSARLPTTYDFAHTASTPSTHMLRYNAPPTDQINCRCYHTPSTRRCRPADSHTPTPMSMSARLSTTYDFAHTASTPCPDMILPHIVPIHCPHWLLHGVKTHGICCFTQDTDAHIHAHSHTHITFAIHSPRHVSTSIAADPR